MTDQDPYHADALDAAISDMADSFGHDYARLADMTEAELERDPSASHFDEQDPLYWRAVVAELRRRAAAG
jgi:hypothetical protein